MRMKFIRPLLLLLLCVAIFCGCSDGSGGTGEAGAVGGSPAEYRDIIIKSALNARAVSEDIAFLRCSCFDDKGRCVYGPKTLPKADKVVLEKVPSYCYSVGIVYLDKDNVPVGIFAEELESVTYSNGVYVINNPEWEDIGEAQNIEDFVIVSNQDIAIVGQSVTYVGYAQYVSESGKLYYQDVTSLCEWHSSKESVASNSDKPNVFKGEFVGRTEISADFYRFSDYKTLKIIWGGSERETPPPPDPDPIPPLILLRSLR